MAYAILRSRVGTYHEGFGHSSFCGVRKCSLSPLSMAEKASPSAFCAKCFSLGKPEGFIEVDERGTLITARKPA